MSIPSQRAGRIRASGDLTPKLSVKRKFVIDKYRAVIEELYRG